MPGSANSLSCPKNPPENNSLFAPQLWGDLYSFSDRDVASLEWLQKLAKQNESVLHRQKRILGDPWKNETYGYAYFQGDHELVFMNNVDFQARAPPPR